MVVARCECGEEFHVPHPGLDVFQLRTAMRMAGWDCFGGDWFCPRHVEAPEHGPLMLAGVEALVALARAHGWEMPPGQEVAS